MEVYSWDRNIEFQSLSVDLFVDSLVTINVAVSCKRYSPCLFYHISLLYKPVVSDGTFSNQWMSKNRKPRVFEIAHICMHKSVCTLWYFNVAMERWAMFNGKIHYKWQCSSSQTVSLPEGNLSFIHNVHDIRYRRISIVLLFYMMYHIYIYTYIIYVSTDPLCLQEGRQGQDGPRSTGDRSGGARGGGDRDRAGRGIRPGAQPVVESMA